MLTFKNTLHNAQIRALKPEEEAKLKADKDQQPPVKISDAYGEGKCYAYLFPT